MSNNSKFVIGTLGAALAGAAAGILLAPKKGTETRKMIKEKANDLSANAKKTWDKNLEKGKSTINDLTEKVKDGLNKNTDSQFDDKYSTENRYKSTAGTAMAGTGTSSPKTNSSDDKYSGSTGSTLGGAGTSSGNKSTNESYQANKGTSQGGTGSSFGNKSSDDSTFGNKNSSTGGSDSSKGTSSNDPTKKYGGSV